MKLTPVMAHPAELRARIRDRAVEGLKAAFPLELRGQKLELEDVAVHTRDFGPEAQKSALLEGTSLHEPVKGTVVLKDAAGKVVDRVKNLTLLHLPYFTERHSFIVDGNEYQVANQIRMKPGVYTRRRANDELEAAFNLAKGSNFRLSLDPKKGHPYMEYGTTLIPLYPVLRKLGVPHEDIARHWGSEVAANNESEFGKQKKLDAAIEKLYGKILHPSKQTHQTLEEKVNAVRQAYDQTTMDGEVNETTLGHAHDKVTPLALLDASKKLLAVYKSGEDVDDRDSLAFKTFHSVDDFIKERIQLDARALAMKVKGRATNKTTIREILPAAPFSSGVRSFLTGSQLSAIPTQINPMEMIDHAVKVTSLGEGGITSERAIPMEARQLHPTHFGILDPVRTPESFSAGVDIRATMLAHRDEKGNLYTPVRDVKSGEFYHLSAKELAKRVVAFPGQKMEGHVDVLKGGKVQKVPHHEVEYEVYHPSQFYSPTTNLIPFMESIQGNRATMGSKMQTQSLPLVERDVPWVQVGAKKLFDAGGKAKAEDSSFEHELGKLVVATAPVSGKVVKIDHQYIYIDPSGKKHAEDYTKTAGKAKRQQTVGGITLKIELEPGDKRSGTSPDGKTWEKTMSCAYGYIPKTEGDDGECVDIYLNTLDPTFLQVYVVHQKKKDGSFDEDKCMVGFPNEASATAAYKLHGPEWGLGKVDSYSWEDFKDDYLEERRKEASEKDLIKIPYETNFPFASKTYLHQDVKVKAGDKVEEGQPLTDSNFTRDGTLALGKNMRVGYLAYYGLNSNDAVVISDGAAKKLTSEQMYKEILDVDRDTTLGRDAHRQYFGTKYTAEQYQKLDSDGVVKKGQKVMPHDLLIAGVRKGKLTATDALLGNIKKTLANPYREEMRDWHHDFEGEVIDVYKSPKRVVVTVKTREPMRIGDKLSGRHGNKGVVSHIVPDHKMVQDESGRPIDILYTSAGVISRINPAQIIETAVAKVAEKTGKPIVVENFTGRDNAKWAKELLAKHDVKDKETVFDPISGKHLPGVLVGPQYTLRLFKTTDSNYAARGTGGYDVNRQPTKGGDTGAKALGKMEFNALVAHNARNVLREAATVKSEQNDEFWRAVQLGLPLPAVKSPFVFDKLLGMLQAAGIQVDRRGNQLTLRPMTDADVKKFSSGAIENDKLVRAKDLNPERGGFFDPVLTGGAAGTRWAHVDLAEHLVNPVFVEPARRLLGLATKEFDQLHFERGGKEVKKRLNALDLTAKEKELRAATKTLSGSKLDDAVKQLKYLAALKKTGLQAGDAYVISKLPVIPPVMRPILPGQGGKEMVVGDSNYLYQNAFLHNTALRKQVENPVLPPGEHEQLRKNLFQAVGAVIGTHETDNQKLEKRNVKGFLVHLTGKTTPKCYDARTDILTESGWVPFPHYDGVARVATVNLGTHTFEWQSPSNLVVEPYTGPMVHTQSREIDLLVTPNHEHVVSLRRKRVIDGKPTHTWTAWSKVRADTFSGCDRRRVMVSAEQWNAPMPELIFEGTGRGTGRGRPSADLTGTFYPNPEVFAEFVGWWLAEGWISTGGAQVSLCQAATSPHVARVDACFEHLNLPFVRRVYTRKDGYQAIWWTIKLKSLAQWLTLNCGVGCENKRISDTILAWPAPMLKNLLGGYLYGDGTLHKAKARSEGQPITRQRRKLLSAHAGTASSQLVDDLQHLATKIGYQVLRRGVIPPVKPGNCPQHLFSVRGFSDVTIEAGTFTHTMMYDGVVYCVTVPNGAVIIRRNGKPAVSGNSSFFQKKIIKRQQDLSGRGTAVPDGTLGMDQVGLPEDMLWSMFGKFVIARLVRRGFGAMQAKEMVEKKHPAARDALMAECNERPVMLNRAPTLHRFSIVGAFAVPVAGKTIRVNPFIEPGLNLDYDGDTLQVHAPASVAAVEDVKVMTMSHLLFGDKQKDDLMVVPRMEAAMGLHAATKSGAGKVHHYKTKEEAVAAYKRGEINLNDLVEIK